VADGEGLSPGVEKGIREILSLIRAGDLDRVAALEPLPG
jgi:hypothetical protein